MRYELINPMDFNKTALETVLSNRGIPKAEMKHYLNTTDDDINDWRLLGEEDIKAGIKAILQTVNEDKGALLIVDVDCDGYTSSALLINYLHNLFPTWVENHISWFHHTDKQHGLEDLPIDKLTDDMKLIICPDSASNDYEIHEKLYNMGKTILILDHHEAPYISKHAITINNQLCDYPNKMLSGAGVTWQFCRAIDELLDVNFADKYIDLCGEGNLADMMPLTSIETKHIIHRALKENNNPFFQALAIQNSYSIGKELTPIGAAFYLAPYVNSMVRSGTMQEKDILFRSMLDYEANQKIPSTKRGHKEGDMETVVTQAIRVAQSVKRKQDKAKDEGMAKLEKLIEVDDMLKEPVLLFTLEKSTIEPNIRGLVANKIMPKYQRPTIVTVKTKNSKGEDVYAGSARGYSRSTIQNFKDVVEQSGLVNYAQGHQGAFGVELPVENLAALKEYFRKIFKDVPQEPTYFVDYIFYNGNINPEVIYDIAELKSLWGQDFNEAMIALEDLNVTPDMIKVLSRDKNPTLKISISGIEVMKFGLTKKELELFDNPPASLTLSVVGTCAINEWCGKVTPQLLITEYEIISKKKYIF